MTWTTIRDCVELALPHVALTGVLSYNPAHASLIVADQETGEAEVPSVDHTVYGYVDSLDALRQGLERAPSSGLADDPLRPPA